MNLDQFIRLDNPVWRSLTEEHNAFAISYPGLKCYHPDYCPFGALDENTFIENSLEAYARICRDFYVVGERPVIPPSLSLKKELVCLQMILEKTIAVESKLPIVALKKENEKDVYDLVNMVQPGYFRPRTMELGNYYGIFSDDHLVAVTGERMKMTGFTELSAVVNHPNHTGKGYASQLITHAVRMIFESSAIPFLHVAKTSLHAISLYQRLGFRTRREISFWNLASVS